MRLINLTALKAELQALADQVGASRFDAAKSAYMQTVTVTDDAGAPLAPDAIDVEVTITKSEEKTEDDKAEKPESSDVESIVNKAVDAAVAKLNKSESRGIRIAETTRKSEVVVESPRYTTQHFKDPESAYKSGMFLLAVRGHEGAARKCRGWGMAMKSQIEGENSLGGFAVPEVLDTEVIRLRNQFGVFPQHARRQPMSSDVSYRLRLEDSLSVAFVGEAAAASATDQQMTRVDIVAKKLGALTYVSNELREDAAIDIADAWVQDAALAMAKRVDQCGFIGDGSATYGGMIGAAPRLVNLGTIANTAGLRVATGTGYGSSYGSMTRADFGATVGRAPAYAINSGRARWYMSTSFYHGVYLPLAASTVTNYAEIINGVPQRYCEGWPVTFTEVLPGAQSAAVNQVVALFGDLSLAADFGERRGFNVMSSEHETTAFKNDMTAIRALMRFGTNIHDVGNNSATASLRIPGPIVGLITAGS